MAWRGNLRAEIAEEFAALDAPAWREEEDTKLRERALARRRGRNASYSSDWYKRLRLSQARREARNAMIREYRRRRAARRCSEQRVRDGRAVALTEIVRAVEVAYGFPVGTLRRAKRTQIIVRARQTYVLLARCYTGASLPWIAQQIRQHHTTILYTLKRAGDLLQDPDFAARLERTCDLLALPVPTADSLTPKGHSHGG